MKLGLLSAQDVYRNIDNWVLLAVDLGRYFVTQGYNILRTFPHIIQPCIISHFTIRNTTIGTEVPLIAILL